MSISSSHDDGYVEITVKKLSGIDCRRGDCKLQIPTATATVTFSGSATEMKIGSSSVCGLTGQLLVESGPLVPDKLKGEQCQLSASWNEDILPGMIPRPHLTMMLPDRDPSAVGIPLAKANKGCRVYSGSQTDEIVRCRSMTTEQTKSTRASKNKSHRSLKLSPSSATSSPEFVEMFIRLRCEEEDSTEQLWQGAAYLVVSGHESDAGTHTVEIPIRKPCYDEVDAHQHAHHDLDLSTNARLTVEVKVILPEEKSLEPPRITRRRYSFHSKNNSILNSQAGEAGEDAPSITDSQMEPLMAMIITNEREAIEHYKSHRSLNVPVKAQEHRGIETGCMCGGTIWNLDQIFRTVQTLVQQCDRTGVPAVTPSVCSTIETRESLDI